MEEQILEAVKSNIGYLENSDVNDVALFLQNIAEFIDSQKVEMIANALRDVEEGVV